MLSPLRKEGPLFYNVHCRRISYDPDTGTARTRDVNICIDEWHIHAGSALHINMITALLCAYIAPCFPFSSK